jgi:hypothetical protein
MHFVNCVRMWCLWDAIFHNQFFQGGWLISIFKFWFFIWCRLIGRVVQFNYSGPMSNCPAYNKDLLHNNLSFIEENKVNLILLLRITSRGAHKLGRFRCDHPSHSKFTKVYPFLGIMFWKAIFLFVFKLLLSRKTFWPSPSPSQNVWEKTKGCKIKARKSIPDQTARKSVPYRPTPPPPNNLLNVRPSL